MKQFFYLGAWVFSLCGSYLKAVEIHLFNFNKNMNYKVIKLSFLIQDAKYISIIDWLIDSRPKWFSKIGVVLEKGLDSIINKTKHKFNIQFVVLFLPTYM